MPLRPETKLVHGFLRISRIFANQQRRERMNGTPKRSQDMAGRPCFALNVGERPTSEYQGQSDGVLFLWQAESFLISPVQPGHQSPTKSVPLFVSHPSVPDCTPKVFTVARSGLFRSGMVIFF